MRARFIMWVLGAVSACSIIYGVSVWGDRQFLLSDLAAAQDDVEICKQNK